MNYHEPQPNEQRQEHTLRTEDAIDSIKAAFAQIEELKRENLKLKMKLYTESK